MAYGQLAVTVGAARATAGQLGLGGGGLCSDHSFVVNRGMVRVPGLNLILQQIKCTGKVVDLETITFNVRLQSSNS